MGRLARVEVFNPHEVACIHTMCRVVRRCFLFGLDPLTNKNYDHRKGWIEEKLMQLSAYFAIDLISFAVMSNHIHQVLRSRPDIVATWDDTEVARRWLMLCPKRKDQNKQPCEPNERELDSIRNNPKKLKETRTRLSDISWWMRLLCQNIAKRANLEEGIDGRFFQGRFKAVRLEDEEAMLACNVYVDLNLIRAGIAQTIEGSDFTSGKMRAEMVKNPDSAVSKSFFISPIELREEANPAPCTSRSKKRCSDKGVLPISELVLGIARSHREIAEEGGGRFHAFRNASNFRAFGNRLGLLEGSHEELWEVI